MFLVDLCWTIFELSKVDFHVHNIIILNSYVDWIQIVESSKGAKNNIIKRLYFFFWHVARRKGFTTLH